jgi:D-alanyl-D-alanine carboxypeptidase
MLRIRTGARHGLRGGLFGFATITAVLTLSSIAGRAAPYSDIVVDANSGSVLHATNPDARRHPASLTKIMTLYLLFEQLEAGKLKLDSVLKVSEEAAGQSPTKLGLKAGTTISVEDAIKGMVTRSANDAAVVVAEAIAGDEDEFAKLMTRKARALGMSRTVYKNASGLPDDDQVTSARDQAILGRAVQERFPQYYKFFALRSFTFRGQWIGNHNRLLGRVEGVDGIKTGYIRSSGFNLVSSTRRGNRHIVAVVMGGSSASSRDARMRELISDNIDSASTKRGAPMIASAGETKTENPGAKPAAKAAAKPEPKPKSEPRFAVASAASMPAGLRSAAAPAVGSAAPEAASPRVAAGSTEPIKPVLVRTVAVKTPPPPSPAAPTSTAAPLFLAALQPVELARVPMLDAPPAVAVAAKPIAPAPAPVAAKPTVPAPAVAPTKGESPVAMATKQLPPAAPEAVTKLEPAPPAAPIKSEPSVTAAVIRDDLPPPAAQPRPASPAPTRSAAAEPVPTRAVAPVKQPVRSGWVIQVGAYPAEQDAKQRLSDVQSKAAKILTGADPFTETVEKGGTTYYRARFAGFDKDKAEAACKYLKRNDVDCVMVKN